MAKKSAYLYEDLPNFWFFKQFSLFLMFNYLLVQVSIITVLHDYTKGVGPLLKKYLFVHYHIRMSDGC